MRVFSKKFTLAAAGGITAIALSSGAVAYAQTDVSPEVATTQQTPAVDAEQREGEEKIAKLADKLGVTEEELTEALKTVRDQDGTDKAKQLAEALGIEESKVEQAIAETEAEDDLGAEENRQVLESRLDEGVKDGRITEADKQAVLKAYDVGVLVPSVNDDSSSNNLPEESSAPGTEAAPSTEAPVQPSAEQPVEPEAGSPNI